MNTNKKAFSLIELLLVMSVIAMIIISATAYFSVTTSQYQIAKTLQDMKAIRSASAEWVLSHPDYTGISLSTLNSAGLIPRDVVAGTPFGGASVYTVAAGTITTQLNISLPVPSRKTCTLLIQALGNQPVSTSCVAASGVTTFSVVFG